jgi:nitrogen fixation/metabolism regulation signal transduction histidine kinase
VKRVEVAKDVLSTEFAPPERSPKDDIKRQRKFFFNSSGFRQFSGFIPDPILILNANRQIVFANDKALKALETTGTKDPYGLRPGEALHCEHARVNSCGCGTSAFCKHCGAVKAILSSLNGMEGIEECSLTQEKNLDALLFQIHTYPYYAGDETFSVFVLRDITRERRMQILEHVFFHDIKNTLTALNGWVDLLTDAGDTVESEEVGRVLTQLSAELIDEVRAQEQIISAETNSLAIQITTIDTLELMEEVRGLFARYYLAEGRRIIVDSGSVKNTFKSDAPLVKRVLINMVKNALEAIGKGQTVTIGCEYVEDQAQFWVHNPGYILPDVQSQIFKWSFSTKGKKRGLGTYSMRMLSERYLQGRVYFSSTPLEGTKFVASYPISPAG